MRSTFIVGFPGETEAEFSELLEFLDQAQLDRVGCFAYSPVEGAAGNHLKRKIGRTLQVLIDAPGTGRSSADAPEIDGVVRFQGGRTGEFGRVRVERADEHDLYGRLL